MHNLNKKQKIIFSIISIIVLIAICYYIYAKDENVENIQENLEIENTKEKEEEPKEEKIFVHISGAVNKEGIIELELNKRIADAIEKAGGLKEDADISDINLAYRLEDGMKIYIPTNQEKVKVENQIENVTQIQEGQTEKYITSSSTSKEENNTEIKNKQNTKVNINTATQTQLETLPGIGPSTALKIINYRKEKGKFNKIEDIKEVSGIGESKFTKIKDLIATK